MISRSNGPSKIKKEFYENLDINSFLKNEIPNLKLDKRIIRNDIFFYFKMVFEKIVFELNCWVKNIRKLQSKKYFEALENDSVLKLGSYKISALSKFLISRYNLVQISNLKKRNFNIFKEILGRKYSPHQNFDLKQKLFFLYTIFIPYRN